MNDAAAEGADGHGWMSDETSGGASKRKRGKVMTAVVVVAAVAIAVLELFVLEGEAVFDARLDAGRDVQVEIPLDRVGDHRLQRTVKTMHGQTPSMEFTSVQAPSAAADIPFRAPHPWCSRSNGLSPTASLLLLRGLSGGHPSREPHRPSRCAAFLACQLRSNYEAAHYQKPPSRPQTIRTIGTVFQNFQRPRLRHLSRARSRTGT